MTLAFPQSRRQLLPFAEGSVALDQIDNIVFYDKPFLKVLNDW